MHKGAKAISWDPNTKMGSTSACYAPLRKKSAGGKTPKVATKGILRGFTPTRDQTGGWVSRGKFGRRRHGCDSEGIEMAPQLSGNRGAKLGKQGKVSEGGK